MKIALLVLLLSGCASKPDPRDPARYEKPQPQSYPKP